MKIANDIQYLNLGQSLSPSEKMPVLFIGHGSPMNALADNPFTRHLRALGIELSLKYEIQAIVVISAHWLTKGSYVHAGLHPETIHDFGGFPPALHQMQYPALGQPEVATAIHTLDNGIGLTEEWGLDHGAWTILHHLWPNANIPVLQLSIDYGRPMSYYRTLSAQLKSLRNRGVLFIGSGNVVHNIPLSVPFLVKQDPKPFDWALEFDAWVGQKLDLNDYSALEKYETAGSAGKLAVPTPEHYIPMLYTLGLTESSEPIKLTFNEVGYGGMSMRSFQIG
jgi:4,5-DOPA dioxygenase extradiol